MLAARSKFQQYFQHTKTEQDGNLEQTQELGFENDSVYNPCAGSLLKGLILFLLMLKI